MKTQVNPMQQWIKNIVFAGAAVFCTSSFAEDSYGLTLKWDAVEFADQYRLEEKLKDSATWIALDPARDVNVTVVSDTSIALTGRLAGDYEYQVIGCVIDPNQPAIPLCEQVATYSGTTSVTLPLSNSLPINIEYPVAPISTLSAMQGALPTEDTSSTIIGTLPGQFRVDESGAATYSVPISLPEGVAGVTPQVSLNYNSSGGNGALGMGGGVGGINSSISRCRQTYEQDGKDKEITLSNEDRLCIDGQKLIVVGGIYGEDGAEYRTEIDSRTRIIGYLDATSQSSHFEVEREDGSISYYGGADITGSRSDSLLLSDTVPLTWYLTSTSDNLKNPSNSIFFNYTKGQAGYGENEILIDTIEYSDNKVDFVYSTTGQRPDKTSIQYLGTQIDMTVQLNRISVFNNKGRHLSSYHLVYDIDAVTQFKRLESIEQCGAGGTPCLPLTTFDWYDQNPLNIESFSTTKSLGNYTFKQVIPIDIDSDGFTDMLSVVDLGNDNFQVKIAYNNGVGTFGASSNVFSFSNLANDEYPVSVQPVDIDGDGSVELLYYSGTTAGNMAWKYYDFNDTSSIGSHTISLGILVSETTKDVSFHDVNGDAYPDMVYFDAGSNHIRLNNRIGGFATNVIPASITMPTRESGPYCFGTTCYSQVTTTAKSMEMLAPADFNGDGRADVVFVLNDYFEEGDHNRYSETFWMAYTLTEQDGSYRYEPLGEIFDTRFDEQSVANSQLYVGQIDNDGLADIVRLTKDSYEAEYSLSSKSGMSLTAHTGMTATMQDALSFQIVDIDRNGRGDFVYFDSELKRWTVHYHTLGGGFTAAGALTDIDDTNHEKGNEILFLTDWNGNGELGVGRFNYVTKELYYRQDNGAVSQPFPANRLKTITNGFGLSTEIHYGLMTNAAVYTKGNGADDLHFGRCLFDGTLEADLDASCTPVFDLVSPTYLVGKVVSDAPGFEATSGTVEVAYQYKGMRAQSGGRGMLGFEKITTYDKQSGVSTETTYRQDFPYIGMPSSTIKYLGEPSDTVVLTALLSQASNTYDLYQLQTDTTYFPYLVSSTEVSYALDDAGTGTSKISTVTTDNTYTVASDNHANLTDVVVTTENADNVLAGTVITTNGFGGDDVSNWWLGRVTSTDVTHRRPGENDIKRTSSFEYYPLNDASGNDGMLKLEHIQPLGGVDENLSTLHCYDSVGNKIKTLTYSNNVGTVSCATRNIDTTADISKVFRFSGVTYDTANRYVVSSQDARFTSSTVNTRNEFGQPTQTTDINGVVSVAAYDSFGRQFASRNSVGQASETQRRLEGQTWPGTPAISESYYFVERSTTAAGPTAYSYFDVMGRQVAAVKQGFDAGEWIYQYSRYDKYGRTVAQSVPGKSYVAANWGNTNYDKFGRIQSMTSADGTASSVKYEGLSTTTEVVTSGAYALTQSSTEVKNVLGETESVTDNDGGTVRYYYDATGNLSKVTGVDSVDIVTIFDDLGRKTQMIDPDKGTWNYKYNAAGELISQIDAKLNKTTFYRDSVGRTTKRKVTNGTDTLETTRYTFDAHQLKGECILSGNDCDLSAPGKEYSYDDAGRIDTLTSSLDGQIFTQSTSYDNYGRVFQQFDATGGFRGIRHYYNARGYAYKQVEARNSADTNADVYYEVKAMDAFGNVIEFRQNNAKVSSYKTYDQLTGYIKGIQADNGALIQDNEYGFDAIGNLRTRTRNSLQNSASAYSESFDYDSLNRLTHINGDKKAEYYANGNIRWKKDVGYYCYISSRPHAVSGVGSDGCSTQSYQYDANGNMTSGRGRTIGYSHYDKPLSIDANGVTTFAYDTGRNRYKRQTTENGVTTKTYYIGNVEMVYKDGVYSETRRYLPDAIQTQYKGGAVHTRYLHKDHLGSIDSITDENGKLVEKLYFDAWGKKQSIDRGQWNINEAFVGLSLGNVSDLTPRGFTGHEHVDHADIIHMNGRIYDPTLGRFLQADPIIQAPKNSQSYNRYSYVLNNPLSYTDPSGYFFSGLFNGIKKYWRQIASIAIMFIPGVNVIYLGFISGYVATGSLKGALIGAFTAGFAGPANSLGGFVSNGIVGGLASKAMGGNFGHGFWSAGIGAALGGQIQGIKTAVGRIVASAVVGGTISKLTGGKFANGAFGAAFARTLGEARAGSFNSDEERINRPGNKNELKKEIRQVKRKFENALNMAADKLDNYCSSNGCMGMSSAELKNADFVWSDDLDDGKYFYNGESIKNERFTGASIDRSGSSPRIILYAGGLAMTGAGSDMKFYGTALLHEYTHISIPGTALYNAWPMINAANPPRSISYINRPHESFAFAFSEMVMGQ